MSRCPRAINLGTLATRCKEDAGHDGRHVARGLAEFPYQILEWFPGDRREFYTNRDDEYAWGEAQ